MGSSSSQRVRLFSPRSWSLATQLFAIQATVILVVLVGAGLAAFSNASTANFEAAREEVLDVARSVAAAPTVREALGSSNPTAILQPFAEQVRSDTETDFVVVMTVDGVRFTHPNPSQIGGHFLGTIEPATRGESLTETFTGTLGPSVRAVVPVMDAGVVRGLVSVGKTVARVSGELTQQIPILFGTTAVALIVAGSGSWLASRWLRRTTHDLGPAELSRMYEFYDAVLHAVREGILLLDRTGRLQLFNDEARRLLALPEDAVGRRVDDVGLPEALGSALLTGAERSDEIFLTDDRIVVVSQAEARWAGRHLGSVVTLRDHTELRALVSELKTIRGFADALSAQAHESANRLHTVVSLIELGKPEQASQFATTTLAVAQHMIDLVAEQIREPEVAALILGKAAEARERGVDLVVEDDVDLPTGVADPRDLVTIVGNLIDNAVDAAVDGVPPRWVRIGARAVATSNGEETEGLEIRVADSGPGLDPEAARRAFQRGWSTKAKDRLLSRGLGLALVGQAVHRYGGAIEVTNDRGAVFTVRLSRPGTAERGDGRDRGFHRDVTEPVPSARIRVEVP